MGQEGAQLQRIGELQAHIAGQALRAPGRLFAPAVLLAAADVQKAIHPIATTRQLGLCLPLAERSGLQPQRCGRRRQPGGRDKVDRAAQAAGAVLQRIGAAPDLDMLGRHGVDGLEVRRAIGLVQRYAVLVELYAAHQVAALHARAADGQPRLRAVARLCEHAGRVGQCIGGGAGAPGRVAGCIDDGRAACALRQFIARSLHGLGGTRLGRGGGATGAHLHIRKNRFCLGQGGGCRAKACGAGQRKCKALHAAPRIWRRSAAQSCASCSWRNATRSRPSGSKT